MPTLECCHCGAPLPESVSSGPIICPYCDTLNEVPGSSQKPQGLSLKDQKAAIQEAVKEEMEKEAHHAEPPARPMPSPSPAPSGPSWIASALKGCSSLVFGIGTLLLIAFFALGGFQNPRSILRMGKKLMGMSLPPSDLAEETSNDPIPLKVPPPPEGWSRLDPGKDLPWLATIGGGWAPDAQLRSLRVVRAKADGTVTQADDTTTQILAVFDSSEARSRKATGQSRLHPQSNSGLELVVAKGAVKARLEWGGAALPPRPTCPSTPLQAVFNALKAANRLPDSPFYNGQLTFVAHRGWVWTLQTMGAGAPIPQVRAEGATVIR